MIMHIYRAYKTPHALISNKEQYKVCLVVNFMHHSIQHTSRGKKYAWGKIEMWEKQELLTEENVTSVFLLAINLIPIPQLHSLVFFLLPDVCTIGETKHIQRQTQHTTQQTTHKHSLHKNTYSYLSSPRWTHIHSSSLHPALSPWPE